MPFLTTRPTSRIRPVSDETSSGMPVSREHEQAAHGRQRRAERARRARTAASAAGGSARAGPGSSRRCATITSSRCARCADSAWPPISSTAPCGSGRSRTPRAPRPRRHRDRRSGVAAVITSAGRRPSRRSTAGASGRSNVTTWSSGSAPRAVGDQRARERVGGVADRVGIAQPHADRALGPQDLRDLAAGRARSPRSAPTSSTLEPEPRELRAARSASAGSASGPRGRRTRRPARRAWRAASPAGSAHASSARAILAEQLDLDRRRGCPARSASTSCRTWTYSKPRLGDRAVRARSRTRVDHVDDRRRDRAGGTSRTMMSPRFCTVAVAGPSSVPVRRVNADDLGRRAEHVVDRGARSDRSPRARCPTAGRSRSRTRPRPSPAGSRSPGRARRRSRRRSARATTPSAMHRWRTSQRIARAVARSAAARARLRRAAADSARAAGSASAT